MRWLVVGNSVHRAGDTAIDGFDLFAGLFEEEQRHARGRGCTTPLEVSWLTTRALGLTSARSGLDHTHRRHMDVA
ncbi:MAG: hypothetical protein R3E42_00430 [Burkholderiaceae bacterium]